MNHQRTPPIALEAEESVLSAALLGGHAEALKLLTPDKFYRIAHQKLFLVISELANQDAPVTIESVTMRLRERKELDECGGAAWVCRLVDSVPSAGCMEYYAGLINTAAMRRDIIARCNSLAQLAYDEPDIDSVVTNARTFSNIDVERGEEVFCSYRDLSQSEPEKWEKIGNGITGLTSGFTKLDDLLGGLQPANLIILAARPGMGKSALMLNISKQVADLGNAVAIFSLEMSRTQLYSRQTASVAKIDSRKFLTGGISPGEWDKIITAQGELCGLPIHIDDSPGLSIREIERRSNLAVSKLGAKLIIVDHIGFIRGPASQRKDLEIGEISRSLKDISKNYNVPVIALSQLNRSLESRDNKRPRLSDLRESGNLEQDADVVLFLYRDEYYYKESEHKGIAELDVAKHRGGPTGQVLLTWMAWRQTFANYHP